MPIPQVFRIDPRDLEANKGIGISVPFNGKGVFNTTYSTKDQIKSNLINLLLTRKGERIENPEFGADLPFLLFENIDDNLYQQLQNQIIESVTNFVPEVILTNIEIIPETDQNTLYVNISYQIRLSGQQDNIIIQLQ